MGAAETQSQPAERIDLALFREILLVPFSIDAAAGRPGGTTANRVEALRSMLREDPEKRWWRIDEPLLHLPEDEHSNGLEGEQRARRLAGAYEEFVYFEPYVQDFLYGGASQHPAGGRPLEVWRAAPFMRADRSFVIGLVLVMAVAFAALFGWRDRLMQGFPKGGVAYFALLLVALAIGICLLLARFSGQ